jgi:hypothetical protein
MGCLLLRYIVMQRKGAEAMKQGKSDRSPKGVKVVRRSHGGCVRMTSVCAVTVSRVERVMKRPIVTQKDRFNHPGWVKS